MTQHRGAQAVEAHHVAGTGWSPRAVRCQHCGQLAREEVRERLSDEEIAVRYGCASCRWHQSRHYHESELVLSAAS